MIKAPPSFEERTKFCFVYCGDDYCDCGANTRFYPKIFRRMIEPVVAEQTSQESGEVAEQNDK